jgi:F0F1-type ATP synthase membrane subunit a
VKLVYIVVGFLVVVGILVAGLLFARGPQPEIIVPAEVITTVGFLNITNTMITAWMVMLFLIILSFAATRSMKLMPSGLQNFMEAVIGFLVSQAEDIAGEKNGRRFFAVVATIFLFIIVSNWFGLLPFFNAIGKTEDVHHHVWHELTSEHPHDLSLDEETHTYTENFDFAGWKMDGGGSFGMVPNRGESVEFEVRAGETPAQAADRYIVFVAKEFADFDATEEDVLAPSPETVRAAAAALNGEDAPLLVFADGEHAEEGDVHPIESPALEREILDIDFSESQKFALIIPFFRSVFSDVNNTLAMGIVAFIMIEFWGIQSLGLGYLSKFFNLKGIMSFVGILELLSEFIRIISFAFRLFGNIFAGEVLILMLTFLMPFLLVDIIYGLELFVGFIQAAVFALLVLVFAVMAVEHHDEEGHGEHHATEGSHDPDHTPGAAQVH